MALLFVYLMVIYFQHLPKHSTLVWHLLHFHKGQERFLVKGETDFHKVKSLGAQNVLLYFSIVKYGTRLNLLHTAIYIACSHICIAYSQILIFGSHLVTTGYHTLHLGNLIFHPYNRLLLSYLARL